ncbi:MAG: hypothetical protein A2V98_12590 [Planctomycetes bacterium RBG_16_64_12]|nr:MAG: hypothetical protein A2V98_12590 [Planctomycetes bacterium RBG_16_64_12]
MSLNRTNVTFLTACALALLAAAPALGQQLRDMQPFAPPDMGTYGGGYRPNEGFFGSFDVLLWWIDPPGKAKIGDPLASRRVVITPQDDLDADQDGEIDSGATIEKAVEKSTHDTGVFDAKDVPGQRYEFGFIEDHHGWLCSIFHLTDQNQKIQASDVHVAFDDAPFGLPPRKHLIGFIDTDLTFQDELPVRFDELEARNKVQTWGVELNYLHRLHPRHQGVFEWFIGARYLELDEDFVVEAFETIADDGDPAAGLGDSWWDTSAENHVVGPQIGARWYRKGGRWTWSTEGRFFAGYNSQNVTLEGLLGSNLDPQNAGLLQIGNMERTAFNHTRHFDEWSPAAELRLDFMYQLTRSVSVGVGWTGFWIDGIARASSLIDYALGQTTADTMGINDENRQDVLMNGITWRIVLNR